MRGIYHPQVIFWKLLKSKGVKEAPSKAEPAVCPSLVTCLAVGPSFSSQARRLLWMCFWQICAFSLPDLKSSGCQLHRSPRYRKARGHCSGTYKE